MKVKLAIGLGNPGKKYEKTYHNAGFLFIDYLIKKNPAEVKSQKSKAKNFEFLKLENIILIKPIIFMNESGKVVKEAIKILKVNPEEILIVHDDSDIELGKYKISFGRGSAGHKGVQSIIDILGAKNFWRLRIGIMQIANRKSQIAKRKIKSGDFVLKKISENDLIILQKLFSEIILKI